MADATIDTGSITIGGLPSLSDIEQRKLDLQRRIAGLNASRQPQPAPSPVIESAPQLNTAADIASELQKLQPLVNQEREQAASDATSRRIAELEAILARQKSEFNAAPTQAPPSGVPLGMGSSSDYGYIPTQQQKASKLKSMLDTVTQIDKLRAQQEAQKPVETKAAAPAAIESKPEQATPTQAQPQPEQVPTEDFSYFNNLMARRDQTRAKAIEYIKQTLPREDWLEGMKLVDNYANSYFKIPDNIAQPVLDAATMKPIEGFIKIGGKIEKVDTSNGEDTGRSVIGYQGKAPTVQEASKFREYLADVNSGISNLDELIQLGKQGSRLSPTDRARAENLARMIQGKFRTEIVGPGAVTENDRKVLESVIGNPLQTFSIVDITTLLSDMKNRVISSRDDRASILGLKQSDSITPKQQGAAGGYVFNQKTGKVEPR